MMSTAALLRKNSVGKRVEREGGGEREREREGGGEREGERTVHLSLSGKDEYSNFENKSIERS